MLFRHNRATHFSSNGRKDPEAAPETPINWRRLLGYLRPYRLRFLLAIAALILSAGLSLVFPAVIRSVVDSVLVDGDEGLLNRITLALLAVFLLRSVTTFIQNYHLGYIGERIMLDLRLELYTHLQQLSLGFYEHRRVGELVSRLSNDVTIMRAALSNNVGTALMQGMILLGAVAVMLVLNWRLTLFVLLLAPVVGIFGAGFGIFIRRTSTQLQDDLADATTVVAEVFQNIRIVKSFAREDYEIARYGGAVQRAFRAAIRLLRIRAVFGPIVAFFAFGGVAAVLWFGGREVLAGRLTGGALIAFLIYGLTVTTNIGTLVNLYTVLQEALGATRRVFELLDQIPDIRDAPDATTLAGVEGRITFERVSFSYDERQEVLHDIELDIAPGEIIALVGPSGAGKSTIFNLIPRFFDPTEGGIRIDGYDLRAVTTASLRAQVGVVPQESLLFGGTIHENIRYGRLDATEAEIIEAAQAANADRFIIELPDGYQTIVGERGIRLSGGQRQRVAIARAILKDPRILLLDEATSSLDSESERLVQEALARLMVGRTTVIIAHRLSTVRVAHRIAVLDGGSIVELGTHDELLTRGGLYARLHAMQFRDDLLVAK